MLLITKDGDFRDMHFLSGTPARVLRITLGNLSNNDLIAVFRASSPDAVRPGWPDYALTKSLWLA